MKLSAPAFNKFLVGIGQRVLWRRSFPCPCVTEHSGAAAPNCPVCHGKGVTWDAPVEGHGGVTSQNSAKKFADFGTFMEGDVILTLPGDSTIYDMGRYDRVALMNASEVFARVVVQGVSDRMDDLLIKAVTRVFWISAGKVVDGSIPLLGEDGELIWLPGGPPPGVQYTIYGFKYPEYFVYQAVPSNRAEHFGEPLPKKVQLRMFDLLGR